ncbi:uncharacterized protein LOC112181683 isoform X2 [Rosa chinensis]|uniref:uncharacterized protein LOC112181683 isoform X2 n=1 Tax=Rosa chinensis TaxID=74649 RepID=UPI000D08C1BC|nr:uncharacterized protein LOC112181683 isoform X2 [Rosa chinensis]
MWLRPFVLLCALFGKDQGTEARLVGLVLAICQCLDWDNSSNGIVLLWPPRHHGYIYTNLFFSILLIVTYMIMDGDLVCPAKMGRSVEVGVTSMSRLKAAMFSPGALKFKMEVYGIKKNTLNEQELEFTC